IVTPDFSDINKELIEYFAKHPEHLVDLHWRKFEELLDLVFRNHGYRTILGTGRADHGIDLRLIQSDGCGELVTLVQAKKYTSIPIRLEAVQAFCAVVEDEKVNRGLFVTTSRFLPSAQAFAERQRHRLVLADSADVAKWCQKAIHRLADGARLIT
ncbi:MAG TPA: restriction endonuclease, partial [Longimicrobium sp.]